MHEDPEGLWGDAWYYEDKLIYVHKRFVAIPQSATTGEGDHIEFDRSQMVMTAITYDEMRPGCYDRDARIADFALNWIDGSLPFPTFPRFCGQTFFEGDDKELGLACVQRLQRLDGRGVVRAVGRREHPALHHPAVGRRARGRGDPAQRGARRPRDLLQRAPAPPRSCRRSTAATGTRCSRCATTGA